MSNANVKWKGQSGTSYEYFVHSLETKFKDLAGNYIFAKKQNGLWVAVYIGQTTSLKDRLSDHEKRDCAIRNGATHIHAHVNKSERNRLNEEKDLILLHSPVCNVQHT